MGLATIPEAIKDVKAGKFVIVVDDEDRENEGDLVIAGKGNGGVYKLHGEVRARSDMHADDRRKAGLPAHTDDGSQ